MRVAHALVMDLELSRSFVAVVEGGTISAAAAELNISQSALSRRLQQFERSLGVQLLIRRREGVELTEAGRRVVSACRQMLDEYSRLCHDLDQNADLAVGLVRVGGGATAASCLLPPCIAQLHGAHPGLRFYVREAGSKAVAADIIDGQLDLGIITSPPETVQDLLVEPLLEDDIVLVAPPGSDLNAAGVNPSALRDRPLIAFEPHSAIRALVDRSLLAAGIEMRVVAELRSIPTMLRMVRETGIPAFVSSLSLVDYPELDRIPVANLQVRRSMGLATRRHVTPSPATHALANVLRAYAAAID